MKLVQLVGAATRRQELKHQGKYRTLNTTEKYFRNTEKLKNLRKTRLQYDVRADSVGRPDRLHRQPRSE